MFVAETRVRVHYALTDQMGFVYHGHYAQFYEIGRGEAIREIGYSYKDIEAMGVIMPVIDIHSRFLKPARYDDLLTIRTILKELPQNHRIVFHSEIYSEEGTLLHTGDVTLFFMELQGMKKCCMPQMLKEKLLKFFWVS